MVKKIKQTFGTHQEVCHVWMSQSQELGRAGYFRFVNETLYVYDKAVARIYNKKTVLINPNIVEDCRMREKIMKAIPKKYKVFEVPSISPLYHQKNISSFLCKIRKSYDSFWRAHKPSNWYNGEIIKELRCYVKHFGLKMPSLAGIQLNTKKARQRIAKLHAKNIDKLWDEAHLTNEKRNKLLPKIALIEKDWIGGKTNSTHLSHEVFPGYYGRPSFSKLRIRVSPRYPEQIESSHGAFVKIKEARVLYKLIKAGKPVHGFKIGHYMVTGLNGTLNIGCHHIQREEVERLATSLKW